MSLEELLKIPSVDDFLFDTSIDDALEDLLTKQGIEPDRERELIDLTDAVLDGALPLDQMPVLLAQAFGVDEAKAKAMSADVAGIRLLPLRDFVPGVAEHIIACGKRVEDYPQTRVGKVKWTADRLAGELAERLQLEFSEVLIRRMGFLIKQYFAGEKTRESTLTFFGRAPSIGGLGLSGDKAKEVLDEADVIRQGAEIVETEEEAVGGVLSSESAGDDRPEETKADEGSLVVSPSHELAAEVPVIAGEVVKAAVHAAPVETARRAVSPPEPLVDEKELVVHAKAASNAGKAAAPAKSALEDAVTLTVEAAAPILQAKRIAKKAFADLARAAIRGVRDLYQTRELLERDFGLSGAELELLTEAIEKGHAAYNQSSNVERQTSNVTHEQPAFQVSAARTKEEEVKLQEAKRTPEERAKQEIASRPAPVKPKLTVGSVPPQVQGEQKVVTDVRAATKLMGPVDQLGAMTPSEFRRLSTSPSEAVQKVEDLLLALEKQSYEDRVRGVKAWRASPINQLYIGMAGQALKESIPIAEVGSRRRAAGEESLSPAEIRAIATLNAKLRF